MQAVEENCSLQGNMTENPENPENTIKKYTKVEIDNIHVAIKASCLKAAIASVRQHLEKDIARDIVEENCTDDVENTGENTMQLCMQLIGKIDVSVDIINLQAMLVSGEDIKGRIMCYCKVSIGVQYRMNQYVRTLLSDAQSYVLDENLCFPIKSWNLNNFDRHLTTHLASHHRKKSMYSFKLGHTNQDEMKYNTHDYTTIKFHFFFIENTTVNVYEVIIDERNDEVNQVNHQENLQGNSLVINGKLDEGEQP